MSGADFISASASALPSVARVRVPELTEDGE